VVGFRFFSAGTAWELAFREALRFLDAGEGTLLLGPSIGDAGRAWIEDKFLSKKGVRFGIRIETWQDWLTARARDRALSLGRGFRPLNKAARREHLRIVARHMATSGAFHHLGDIWKEEKFFAALLDVVNEARNAGLVESEAYGRAQDLLKTSGDEVTREAYSDFWALLGLYESFLLGAGERLDEASLLLLAAEEPVAGADLFLLGFDEISFLQAQLLQAWAHRARVEVPFAISPERISAMLRAAGDADDTAELSLRGLVTGYAGETVVDILPPDPVSGPGRLLEAHSPSEEARAAAALARAAYPNFDEIRFVASPGYFDDRSAAHPFCEELALPENFRSRKSIADPLSRLFFQVLSLKEQGYPLGLGLELGKMLEFTSGKFDDLASRATRAGVRKGLGDWKQKAKGDAVLEEFAAFLGQLDRELPNEGTAQAFALVVAKVAELTGLSELARCAPNLEFERNAHAALSSVIRNAQMLASSSHAEEVFRFPDWVQELKVALAGSEVGEALSFFPKLQFYHFGEWLPPSGERVITFALGLNHGVGPSAGFQFFLEEGARRRLSELLLPTSVQRGLTFFGQMGRISRATGTRLFSWCRHDDAGAEKEPSWVTGTLAFEPGRWPEVARENDPSAAPPVEHVRVADPAVAFSASFLELYKECPFKAFAEKVLRLEDKVQDSSLDLSRLEEGSFVHKVLELYYGKYDGKQVDEPADRERLLARCVTEARETLRIEYFRGSAELLEVQLTRLRGLLLEFLNLDADAYEKFPFFGQPELEKKVSGELGNGIPWTGKVDRVDYDFENKRFLVTDYKIGAAPPANAEVNELNRFQLQLYLDAIQKERQGWEAIGGVYSSVTSGERGTGLLRKDFNSGKAGPKPGEVKYFTVGGTSRALHEPPAFEELRERSRVEALRLASLAVAGEFPVTPLEEENSCKRCSIRPACRIRELRAPPREPWVRPAPAELLALLEHAPLREALPPRERRFNPEQTSALERRGSLVFIEASAGTGKTTVIVERVRRFLAERMCEEPAHLAVERFCAISFTEKSAQELAARLATTLLQDSGMGPRVAAQAQNQVSTIHGFCRKVIGDFPLEAGVSPLASMLDAKGAESLRRETIEDFFLHPSEAAIPLLAKVFNEFPRTRVEDILVRLLDSAMLFSEEIAQFRAGGAADRLFPEGGARDQLLLLLELGDLLAVDFSARKREASALDFADLEALTLKVLENEHARDFYRKKLELLLIDEFQDTNAVQRQIFERVARPGWGNLFVVGDAKQSIYRFRAADVSVFQGLRKEAEKNGNLVTLGTNYRSRSEIVEAANRITAAILPNPGDNAPDYEALNAPAKAHLEPGARVGLIEYGAADQKWKADERRAAEAPLVAKLVRDLQSRPNPPKTIAILLRKFSGNEGYLRALTRAGVSFRVGASKGFYGQSVVMDSIALLRALFGAKNDIALLAVLRSPWFRFPDQRLLEVQRRGQPRAALWDTLTGNDVPLLFAWKRLAVHSSLAGLLEQALKAYPLGRREHLQTVKLLSIIDGLEAETKPRAEILESLSSWAGWDREEEATDDSIMPEPSPEGAGSVRVMTVHAAKGLEFDVTILADLCGKPAPDNFPLRMVRGAGMVLKLPSEEKSESHTAIGRLNSERELAELKRLFYVAITRAKEEEYFFLPRSFTAEDSKKWNSCGHFLRAADLNGIAEKIDADDWVVGAALAPPKKITPEPWPAPPSHDFFRSSSITEIADYNTCSEFHRLKNIQRWDDLIVEMWPKDLRSVRKKAAARKNVPRDPDADKVTRLLKTLSIERKERGIALHRVLERVKVPSQGLESAAIWLREAYEAQGVSPDRPELEELLQFDLKRLKRFLASPLAADFFSLASEAFPEIPFQWKVGGIVLHGAIDRLVKAADGSWLVVDYKSSIQEQSLDDYRFQVASYMAAVREHAIGLGETAPTVTGYLVDLFAATSLTVRSEQENAMGELRKELAETAKNYTPADTKPNLVEAGVTGGEHCFSCPYSFHCEIGKQIVLTFSKERSAE
jgi:ATP-dependent exoDNAse (exonuclease V) beta subunit